MLEALSIRNQLRLLTAAVALPLFGLAAYSIRNDFRTSLLLAEQETTTISFATASTVARYLAETYGIADALAATSGVLSLDPGQCAAALEPVAVVVPEVSNLVVNRTDGSLVCSVLPLPVDRSGDVSDRAWVRRAIETRQATLSPPFEGRISQTWVSTLTTPLFGVDGTVLGTLTAALDLGHLQRLVETIELPAGGLLTIADTSSIVIARSEDGDEWVGQSTGFRPGDESWADLSRGSGYNVTTDLDGIDRLFSFDVVEGSPWVVWSGIPTSAVYAPARTALYPKLGLAALILALTSLLAVGLNDRIRLSVTGLIDAMDAAEQRPDVRLAEAGPAELTRIATRYNRILDARSAAEQEVALNADRRALLMRATNDPVWDWDLTADAMTVNPQFVALLGDPGAGPGNGWAFWQSHIHPDDAVEAIGATRRRIESGASTWTNDFRIRRVDGKWAEVLSRGYVARPVEGGATRIVGSLVDVTERREARRVLDRARARYQSIIKHAVFGVYVATPEGEILEANPALLTMLGLATREEALACNERDFYENPSERDAEASAALAATLSSPIEARWRRKDGEARTVRIFRSTFHDEDGSVALEVIAEDLTERRILEEQFRQAQKMEAMGRLAGGVAHDFNNRLTVIRGRAQLIRDQLWGRRDLLESLDAILESADGAAKLTRELLAVSRKQLFRPQRLSVNEVLERMLPMLDALVGDAVKVESDLSLVVPDVLADPGQIEQIVINLVLNARDAVPEGGTVHVVTVPRVVTPEVARTRAGLRPGPYLAIEVRDQGEGIPPEVLARAFEPFFSTKPTGQGTGLGLASVYGLAKQNDGYVSIESAVGEGTVVQLLLPAIDETSPAANAAARPAVGASGRGRTVLVVEDEESVRMIISRTLRHHGYSVIEAEDGKAALGLSASVIGSLDLVVTDVVMPEIGGGQLADELTRLKPNIRVLFISGYLDRLTESIAAGRPGRAFLAKPFTPAELTGTVGQLLSTPLHADR